MSPAAQAIPTWCQKYRLRLQAVAEQVCPIKEDEEPEEAELGFRVVEMREQNAVSTKLQELTQQMAYVVQACNNEKEVIEEKFKAVQQDLEILEARICTEKERIEREVSAVRGPMIVHQVVINKMRQGIGIFQSQDNVILQEAGEIFRGIHKQIDDGIKKQLHNGSTLLIYRKSIMKIPDGFKLMKAS